MAVQERNSELVQLLAADFQRRYEPNFAWVNAINAGLMLPALRAFWPMSSVDYSTTNRARDVSGGGYHLSDNSTVIFGYTNLIPYAEFDGTADYLSRADGGVANWADITGAEAFVLAAEWGLTLGGWFYFDDISVNSTLMGKFNDNGVNQRSYMLFLRGANTRLECHISSAGTAATTVICVGTNAIVDSWQFVVGRFDPSTSIDLFINGTWYTQAAAATASAFDSTSAFTIGAGGGANYFMNGKASLCWLSACYISDSIIECYYAQTRALFGA